jgi:hypothetical protein
VTTERCSQCGERLLIDEAVCPACGASTAPAHDDDPLLQAVLSWDRHSTFRGCNLSDYVLPEVFLAGADLCRCNLLGANLFDANLQGANLFEAWAQGANLFGANLRGANLCCANLECASLRQADLRDARFYQADLGQADLVGADLSGADLSCANLAGANLRNALLVDAFLFMADLRDALVTAEQLCTAWLLAGSIMSDGKVYDGRFNLEGDINWALSGHIDIENSQAMADFYGVSLPIYQQGQIVATDTAEAKSH